MVSGFKREREGGDAESALGKELKRFALEVGSWKSVQTRSTGRNLNSEFPEKGEILRGEIGGNFPTLNKTHSGGW